MSSARWWPPGAIRGAEPNPGDCAVERLRDHRANENRVRENRLPHRRCRRSLALRAGGAPHCQQGPQDHGFTPTTGTLRATRLPSGTRAVLALGAIEVVAAAWEIALLEGSRCWSSARSTSRAAGSSSLRCDLRELAAARVAANLSWTKLPQPPNLNLHRRFGEGR